MCLPVSARVKFTGDMYILKMLSRQFDSSRDAKDNGTLGKRTNDQLLLMISGNHLMETLNDIAYIRIHVIDKTRYLVGGVGLFMLEFLFSRVWHPRTIYTLPNVCPKLFINYLMYRRYPLTL